MAILSRRQYNRIISAGRILFDRGLVDTRSGNISVKLSADRLLIKRTGENMGDLRKGSFIILPISRRTSKDVLASSDLELHRKVYLLNDEVRAILHSHPPEAVALSHAFEEIYPTDYEAKQFIEKIKFVEYDEVPDVVSKYRVCVARFHGVFCAGQDVDEALLLNLLVANTLRITLYELVIGARTR